MSNVNVDLARSFIVGETVHLEVRVSKPGTKTPTDPTTVQLASLKKGSQAITVSSPDFTRVAEGDFTYTIHTATLQPGTYNLVVRVASGTDEVVLVPDAFVLNPAP
jgi:hypothetical protein